MNPLVTKNLRIHGKVQGVFYRASLRAEAERLGVTGWVRNRRDGSVEAVVQGSAAQVAKIVEWAKRGPPAAEVTHVDAANVPDTETFAAFVQWPTA